MRLGIAKLFWQRLLSPKYAISVVESVRMKLPTQGKTLHSRAVVSADDTRKKQELDGLQRHDLALRTELKETKEQWFALQKQLRLQAVTDKSGHTETLMTVDTWRPRTLDNENVQRAVGVESYKQLEWHRHRAS